MLELALNLGLWSHHWRDGDYNETHDLIGVEIAEYSVATYENSYGRETWLLTKRVREACDGRLCYEWQAGLVHGYRDTTLPILFPRIRYEVTNNSEIYLTGFPGYVTAVGFRFTF